MRFEQRNSAWIETESARSAAEVSSLLVLYGRVRRGGGKGGGVGKIVKYGGISNDRSSDKKSHKVRFERALFKQIGPQLLYGLPVDKRCLISQTDRVTKTFSIHLFSLGDPQGIPRVVRSFFVAGPALITTQGMFECLLDVLGGHKNESSATWSLKCGFDRTFLLLSFVRCFVSQSTISFRFAKYRKPLNEWL